VAAPPRAALPDETMPGVAALIFASYTGGDVEAALDAVDTREAAHGLAWLLGQMIALTGMDPADFMRGLKTEIIGAHLRRAVTPNV
jgi:hypothetical protein